MALKVGELYASFGIDTSGVSQAIGDIDRQCTQIAASLAKTGAVLSAAFTAPIVGLGKQWLDTGIEFESQMSRVQGISESTKEELFELTKVAKELGASSVFSASEAAQGMEYLASAGFNATEIIAAMPGMLDLAASSGEDLAVSAEIASTTLRGFSLEAGQAGHVADVLALNAAKTNAAVADTGEAMKYIAPVAKTMGLSLEEVTASIGILADSGIKGSQAGTTLRSALTRLAKPTKAMKKTMDELNLSFYDSDGKMKSISQITGMLETNMAGLTDEQKQNALVTLFGQEALSGMMVLMEAGPEKINELAEAYENAGGAAKTMADIMLDNLKGDIEEFNGAVETLSLNLFDKLKPSMRGVMQSATELVGKFNALDDGTKDAIFKIVALAAAAGPAMLGMSGIVLAAGKLIPLMIALASPIGIVVGGLALLGIAAASSGNDIGNTFVSMSKGAKKELSKVNGTIKATLKDVSNRMPALTDSIVEGMNNILPGITDLAANIVTGLMDSITSNASNIADVGMTFITNIVSGISKNLPQIAKSGLEMVVSIASSLISNIPKLVASAKELGASILEAIKGVDWISLGTTMWEAIKTAFNGVVAELAPLWDELLAYISSIDWSKLGSDIWNWISGAWSTGKGWLREVIMGDANTPITWTALGDKIWGWIKGAFTSTTNWLAQTITGDAAYEINWTQLGADIWSWIKGAFTTTTNWLKDLIIGESGSEATWADVGGKIWGWIEAGFVIATDWLKGLILGDSATESTWGDVGGKIWGWISGGFVVAGDWLKGLILGTGDNQKTWSDVGKDIGDWLSSGFRTATTQITTWFGITKLNYEDVQKITSSFTVPKAFELNELVTAKSNVTNLSTEVGKLQTKINETALKISLGIEIGGADASQFASTVNGLIKAGLDTINASQYSVNLNLKTLFGNGETGQELSDNLFAPFFDQVTKDATEAGEKARNALVSAMADGNISAEEAAKIQIFTEQFTSAVEQALAQNEIEASMLRLRVENSSGMLNPADISNIVREIREQTQAAVDALTSSESSTIDLAYKAAAALELDPVQTKTYIDSIRKETMDMIASTQVEAINWSFDLLTDQLGVPDFSKLFYDGEVSWTSSVNDFYSVIEQSSPGFREKAAALLRELKPSTDQLTALKESYVAAGLEVPQSIADGLSRAEALQAIQGGALGIFKWLSDTFGVELEDLSNISALEMSDMLNKLNTILQTDSVPMRQSAADMWNGLFDTSFSAIQQWRPELEATLRAMGIDVGSLLGIALPEGVASGLKNGTISVKEAASEIAALATVAEGDAKASVDKNIGVGEDVGTGLATGQDNASGAVTTSAEGLKTAVETPLLTLPQIAGTAATDTVQAIATEITATQSQAVTAMDTMTTEVVNAAIFQMSADNGTSIGNSFVNAIIAAVNSLKEPARSAASSLASGARSITASILSWNVGHTIGFQFDAGIAQGIRDGIYLITSASRAAAQAAINTSKSTLKERSPSRIGRDDIGLNWPKGIALGVLDGIGYIENAASHVTEALRDDVYVGDPSRGTVYSSSKTIKQTAKQTAQATEQQSSALDKVTALANAIARALIDSGAVGGDVYMDGDKVGEKVASPVSKTIQKKTNTTISGRSAKAVLA